MPRHFLWYIYLRLVDVQYVNVGKCHTLSDWDGIMKCFRRYFLSGGSAFFSRSKAMLIYDGYTMPFVYIIIYIYCTNWIHDDLGKEEWPFCNRNSAAWIELVWSHQMTGDVCCATIPFSSAALRGGQLLYLVLLVTWLRGACGSCARSGSSSINGKCSTTWASPVVSDYGWPLSIGEPQHQLRGFAVNVFYVNCFGGLGPQRLLSLPVAASPTSPSPTAKKTRSHRFKKSHEQRQVPCLMPWWSWHVMTYMTLHGWNPAQVKR